MAQFSQFGSFKLNEMSSFSENPPPLAAKRSERLPPEGSTQRSGRPEPHPPQPACSDPRGSSLHSERLLSTLSGFSTRGREVFGRVAIRPAR